jgi:cephalosporin hydroxylase
MTDDRADFAEHQRAQALALGRDAALFDRSVALLVDLDRYQYTHLWTWMGVPIIQRPADVMATQEAIWAARPDIIIETGVARGGSVIFMASQLALMGGQGRVIGVDIDIRPHNRASIEAHPMGARIDLVEGSSVAEATLARVLALIPPGARVMAVLDSDHSRDHVLAECRAYGPLVTPGCHLVVADTIVGHLSEEQVPRTWSKRWFKGNEPLAAARDFLAESPDFVVDEVLNAKLVLSSSPGGYLLRR